MSKDGNVIGKFADLPDSQKKRLLTKLAKELGEQIVSWLDDSDVTEINLNPDGSLWTKRFSKGKTHEGDLRANDAKSAMNTIASMYGVVLSAENPRFRVSLPLDGSRITCVVPVSEEGLPVARPIFSIRKKATRVFTFDDYIEQGTITTLEKQLFESFVGSRKNVVIAGATYSGKTTLTNAFLNAMSELTPHDRTIIVESDTELQCNVEDVIQMVTTPGYSAQEALETSMSLDPDRIMFGEVKGGEAFTLLKSWNTGHDGGIATLHAGEGKRALSRLESLCAEHPDSPNESRYLRDLIGEAVDLIVIIKAVGEKRTISEVVAVDGYDHEKDDYHLKYMKNISEKKNELKAI